MSVAKWCDVGQHAFPAGQPGATTIKLEQQVKNQWGGYQPNDTVQDLCASCARDQGMRGLANRMDISQEELDKIADEQRQRSGGIDIRKAIGSSRMPDNPPSRKDGKKLVDGEEYDRYIQWLEEQDGVAP
jgi:hypothetical protein